MRQLPQAIADFDAALQINPKYAEALFGRGVARRLQGNVAAGDADIAAALVLDPKVADELARRGVRP